MNKITKKTIISLVIVLMMVLNLVPFGAISKVYALSDLQNVTISQEGVMSWDAFEGAGTYNYSIYTGGGYEDTTSLDLKAFCDSVGFESGTYTVKLYAMDDYSYSGGQQISNVWEGTYTYVSTTTKIATPTNVQLAGTILSWDSVQNAEGYGISIDGGEHTSKKFTTTSNTVDLLKYLEDGTHSYTIGIVADANGYKQSDHYYMDASITATRPSLQNVSISSEGIMAWDAFNGASIYSISMHTGEELITSTNIDLNLYCANHGYDSGTYNIELYAMDDYGYSGGGRLSQIWEGTYTYSKETSPEPTFSVIYDFNGGNRHGESKYVTSSVGFVPIISVSNFIEWMEVTAPNGKELDAIEINGKRYELGSYYELNKDTTYKYIWKDNAVSHTHSYTKITTKATTSRDGSIVEKCSCGKVKSTTVIPKIKTVKLSKTSFTYNKEVQKPTITIKDSKGKKLKEGTDYNIKYSNKKSKKVGEYTVTITFKGNYTESKKLAYTIKPKGIAISKLTNGKKQFTATWEKNTTETTGYEIQYSTNKNFKSSKTSKIKKNKTTSSTIKSLKAKKKYYVRIRTYKTVSGKTYYSSWSKILNVKTK